VRKVLAGRVAELERDAGLRRQDDDHGRVSARSRRLEREIAEEVMGPEEALALYGPPEPDAGPEAPGRELSPAALRQAEDCLLWLRQAGEDGGPARRHGWPVDRVMVQAEQVEGRHR
jgi:hypothetical protein